MPKWREDPSLYAHLARLLARLGPDLDGSSELLARTLRLLHRADPAVAAAGGDPPRLRARLRTALDRPDQRLAVYGTLAPGRCNHHVLVPLGGRWSRGRVRGRPGRLGTRGGEPSLPALDLDPEADEVEVHLLTSRLLPRHWARLDAFEGPAYHRVLTPVLLRSGLTVANLYARRT